MTGEANPEMIAAVARLLGDLKDEVVFVGGATVPLLITDPAAPAIRSTLDVDLVADLSSLPSYYSFCERLRVLGFSEVADGDAPICRWKINGLLVDVIPISAEVLGFGNRWHAEAHKTSALVELAPGLTVRLNTAPYFLASKIEAFRGRGGGDYVASHDMEDIIAVVDGREAIVDDVLSSEIGVRLYLAEAFSGLLKDARFRSALPMHLPPDSASQARAPLVEKRLREIAATR